MAGMQSGHPNQFIIGLHGCCPDYSRKLTEGSTHFALLVSECHLRSQGEAPAAL